jgi:hypothetical protein
VPGNSRQSLLVARMRSHDPLVRMPPLGVSVVDAEGRRQGRAILPPMPIPMYKHFTDADLEAIYAYLQSIPAVKNRVPEPTAPVANVAQK